MNLSEHILRTIAAGTLALIVFPGCERRDRQPSSSSSSSSTTDESAAAGQILTPDDLELVLPQGWVEHSNAGGPKEYRPRSDGSTGILQVSKLRRQDYELVAMQGDLGTFAAELGKGLGTRGQNWGSSAGNKQGNCALGRFGFSMFTGGEYPAMLLWVTVSNDSGLMWTWLGPSPAAPEVDQAVKIVLEARQRSRGASRP